MASPDERHWGYSLWKQSGVSSGVMYPILWRMTADGWLATGQEEPGYAQKRPPRRYYTITDEGRAALTALLTPPG